MPRPKLEVADIFRRHGEAWRVANDGHVNRSQLRVMSAIEACRTAALGGHVERCENAKCGHTQIAYNSCRNRHRATRRPTSAAVVSTRGPGLFTAAVIPTTRSAAWKFDALRGKRLAQCRSWPNPPLRDKLRE
jgi:hypothetical protein